MKPKEHDQDPLFGLGHVVLTSLVNGVSVPLPSGRILPPNRNVRFSGPDVAAEGGLKVLRSIVAITVEGFDDDGNPVHELPPETRPDPERTFRILPVMSREEI